MKRTGRFLMLASVAAGLVFVSGCSTISDWFGWGEEPDETTAPIGGTAPAVIGGPGPWTAPGTNLPTRDKWTPVPGIILPTIYFAYDQSAIGTTEQVKLEQVANFLMQNKDMNLIIEGNCDERGSLEYNRGLSERRALSVRDYLAKMGVADTRTQTQSYGEERPADPGHDEAAYAKNRRADLIAAK